jgi:hypothetical protein
MSAKTPFEDRCNAAGSQRRPGVLRSGGRQIRVAALNTCDPASGVTKSNRPDSARSMSQVSTLKKSPKATAQSSANGGQTQWHDPPTTIDGKPLTHEHERRVWAMYKDCEVSVPPRWSEGTEPGKMYWQECFYRASRYILNLVGRVDADELSKVYLVHGRCAFSLGAHAWVELPGDVMFDGVRQRFYRLSACSATPWYRYTAWAAIMLNCHMPQVGNRQCYAFYQPLKLPLIGPNEPPLLIDEHEAWERLISSGCRPDLASKPRKRGRRAGAGT